MSRIYSAVSAAVAETAAQDLIYLKPAAEKPIKLIGFSVAIGGGTADAADAQEELLRLELILVPTTVTVGSGGTSVTPTPMKPNDTAASVTARANDTTVATTSGTLATIHTEMWNSRIGALWYPPEGLQKVVQSTNAVVLRLNTAPNDSVLGSVTFYFEELV